MRACVHACVSEQRNKEAEGDLVEPQLRDDAPDTALSTVVPLLLIRHAQPGMEA